MALFLKYRPQNFADLVGQASVRKTLQNALEAEKPSHAYLFTGSRGTGKTSTARIFAKALNCENLNHGDPCMKCETCKQTADGTLVDVIEIDAASNRGIDEIRDLREKIQFAPSIGKRKIYIIDEVHMLTKEAFNALLKTLEEPPDHAYFCLATTEMNKIPETILSRCQVFIFQRFTEVQLVDRLKYICENEKFNFEEKALSLIAKKAEGGMRDAISLLEQVVAETGNNITEISVQESLGISSAETLENFYTALSSGNTEMGLDILKIISQNGQDLRSFGHDFLSFLREKMFESLDETQELSQILNMIEVIEKALFQLKTSPIMELPLEMAVVKLTRNIQISPVTSLNNSSKMPIPPTPFDKGESRSDKNKNSSQANPLPPKNVRGDLMEGASKNVEGKNLLSQKEMGEKSLGNDKFNGFVFEDEPEIPPTPFDKGGQKEIINKKPSPQLSSVNMETLGTLQLTEISKYMEILAQKSELPIFAKKSFLMMTAKVVDSEVIFYTNSGFHKDQLAKPEIIGRLETVISELFKESNVSVKFLKNGENNSESSTNEATADDILDF